MHLPSSAFLVLCTLYRISQMCPALPDYFTFSQGPNKRFFKNPLISIKLNNSIFLAEALFSNSIFTRQKKPSTSSGFESYDCSLNEPSPALLIHANVLQVLRSPDYDEWAETHPRKQKSSITCFNSFELIITFQI